MKGPEDKARSEMVARLLGRLGTAPRFGTGDGLRHHVENRARSPEWNAWRRNQALSHNSRVVGVVTLGSRDPRHPERLVSPRADKAARRRESKRRRVERFLNRRTTGGAR